MKNDSSRISLIETTLHESVTLNLIKNIIIEDNQTNHIWHFSQKSLIWERIDALRDYLAEDFEFSHLYLAKKDESIKGLFGAINISTLAKSANLLVWIDKSVRSKTFLIKWWIYFLLEMKLKEIEVLHAKISITNHVSLNAAKRYGFHLPINFCSTKDYQNKCLIARRITEFNDFEKKYLIKHVF